MIIVEDDDRFLSFPREPQRQAKWMDAISMINFARGVMMVFSNTFLIPGWVRLSVP